MNKMQSFQLIVFLIAGRHRMVALATKGHFHALKEWRFFHAR